MDQIIINGIAYKKFSDLDNFSRGWFTAENEDLEWFSNEIVPILKSYNITPADFRAAICAGPAMYDWWNAHRIPSRRSEVIITRFIEILKTLDRGDADSIAQLIDEFPILLGKDTSGRKMTCQMRLKRKRAKQARAARVKAAQQFYTERL